MNCSILHHQAKYLPVSNSIANFALILEGSLHIDLKAMVILKLNSIGVMSLLFKTWYLPPVTSRHLLGDPPPSPSGVTSFMDDPKWPLRILSLFHVW